MTQSYTTKKQKEDNLKTLQNEYESLQNSGTATEEELIQANNKYNEAYAEYEQFINTVNTEVENLKSQFYALMPNYTNSWKTTTNTTNNVELDLQNYSGDIDFALWVKITDGTNTYYDVNIYSTNVPEEDKQEPGNSQTDGEWTNFSKAKFNLVKNGSSDAIVEVSEVIPKEDSFYYLYLTNNANKVDISKISSEEMIPLGYQKESGKFIANSDKISAKVERNQDIYVTVMEEKQGTKNVVSYGTKLERYSEPKYSDAFSTTFMVYDGDQIITSFTHAKENNRKIQIKVGKITDKTILQKIKNQNSSGFSDLMSFAKANAGIYDKTMDADKDTYCVEYNAQAGNSQNSVINLSGLEDEAYYYLYIKTDDENGKYISNEAVTFAQAGVIDKEKWYMFFYGSSDFKWSDFGEIDTDNTQANGVLPQTGANYIILTMLGVVIIGVVVARIKYKKYDF